jgi:PAS domain S-box-containing protein
MNQPAVNIPRQNGFPLSGEMSELLKNFDWTNTSVGPMRSWSEDLKATLRLVLYSSTPMLLFWGKDLLCFYNDAFKAISANSSYLRIGQKGKELFEESWGFIVALVNQVLTNKRGLSYDSDMIPFFPAGEIENAYWTFTYTPLINESGDADGVVIHCFDTTQNFNTGAAIEESEARFRNLADQAPMLVWMVDTSAQITYANKALLNFIQVQHYRDVAVQGGWESVTHPDDIQEVYKRFLQAIEQQKEYSVEARLYNKNLKRYEWFLFKAAPRLTKGQFGGFIGTAVNIQDQKILQDQLQQSVDEKTQELRNANMQLSKSNQELEQFAYIASHDLQEPLRKIQTFSHLIQERFGPDLQAELQMYLEKINSSAVRMADLIRDLLEYSRLSFHDEHVFKAVDLNTVLDGVLNDFEVALQEKEIKILRGDLPVIEAIPIQMKQLFYNLIGNSIKFSRKGSKESRISITASPPEESDFQKYGLVIGNEYVKIEFEDNGIGFSDEHAERIFQIFQRLNNKATYSGYGIGLALCRKIAANHGGYISATGEENSGAKVIVILPVKTQPVHAGS